MKRFSRSFFSVVLLSICSIGIFYFWKYEQHKNEKRFRLDRYYSERFEGNTYYVDIMMTCKSHDELMECLKAMADSTEKIEAEMLQDGYDRAEVNAMRTKVFEEFGVAEKLKMIALSS